MKKVKLQELQSLLTKDQQVDFSQLTDQERAWLNTRGFEVKDNFIRIICEGEGEAIQAKEILNKVKGDRLQITRIIVGSERTRENIKTLMKG